MEFRYSGTNDPHRISSGSRTTMTVTPFSAGTWMPYCLAARYALRRAPADRFCDSQLVPAVRTVLSPSISFHSGLSMPLTSVISDHRNSPSMAAVRPRHT